MTKYMPTSLVTFVLSCYTKLLDDRLCLEEDIQQARLRLYVIAGISLYFAYQVFTGSHFKEILPVLNLIVAYSLVSLVFLYWAKKSPDTFLYRRIISIPSDCIAVTGCLMIGGSAANPFIFLFLWIVIANGYRFGVEYLIYSGIVSVLLMCFIYMFNDYWGINPVLIRISLFSILLASLIGCFYGLKKMQDREDSEHVQAYIRIVINSCFLSYFFFVFAFYQPEDEKLSMFSPVLVMLVNTLLSFLLYLHIVFHRSKFVVRRLIGMSLDFAAPTYLMMTGTELASPLIGVFLWVVMGNGFRYGVNYLYFGTVAGVVSFSCVIAFNSFWQQHFMLSVSFLLMLLTLPLYAASLLKRLNFALEQARDANMAKTQFLANMSHELRTPLNAVIAISDLLMDANVNEYQRRLVSRVQSAGNLLLGVIEHILDISKIETGKIDLEKKVFDLYLLISNVVSVFEMQAKSKGLTFKVVVSPSVPVSVVGDANRINQVLVNLLGNAIKFTDKGSVIFRISLKKREEGVGASMVCFDVEDTGIGIPHDRQQSIFEPFVQADDSITRKYGGTGLGMSISRQLIKTMQGNISLTSEQGVGTTFRVDIPLVALTASEVSINKNSVNAVKVFVFERDAADRRIGSAIDGFGFQIMSVPDLRDANISLSQYRENTPIILLLSQQSWSNEELRSKFFQLKKITTNFVQLAVVVDSKDSNELTRLSEQGVDWVLSASYLRQEVQNVAHYLMLQGGPVDNVVSLSDYYKNKRGRSLKLLVCEDNEINQMVMKELLLKVGHDITLAEDGETALDMLDSERFDLAIIDINMPKISGLEVVKVCRFRSDLRDFPIIVLSADATPEMQKRCKDAGANEFLTKPFDAKELLDVIAGLSDQLSAADSSHFQLPVGIETSAAVELVNYSVLQQLTSAGIDADFMEELLGKFISQGERLLGAIKSAEFGIELSGFKDEMHSIKGAAAYLGAARLVKMCEKAEQIGSNRVLKSQKGIVDDFEQVFKSTQLELASYIRENKT